MSLLQRRQGTADIRIIEMAGNPPGKEVNLKVEFSPIEIEEVLHEEVAFFGKPDYCHP
ncbi:hypothetical protein [Herminiimonas contaminans]|uniref:hypothetical protein n=1 Tax=Herminiimonas contaminans TaxID=1111140 RepID=UPI001E50A23B|nr:hypothetical protein [Herminiimonas contaminans]